MITQAELKTLVPSLVMSGVLLYEAISGNAVSNQFQNELVNGILIGAGYMVTLWGIWKNHQKNKPPEQTTPSVKTANVNNIEETKPIQAPELLKYTTGVNTQIPPIVTQTDLNNRLQG